MRSHAGRITAIVAALAVLASWQTVGPTPVARAADDLPIFTSTGAIIDPDDPTLPHNPTGEFIFPTVFHAGNVLPNALGEWYLYYAPHDAPGGIELMYADSLSGPWHQYANNPVVSNVWPGVYSVQHVSAPDVYWKTSENRLYLFFHGDNSIERWATSTDGLTFTYGGTAVTTAMVNAAQPGKTATETSYGRVFANPDTAVGGYAMFFMTNYSDNRRRINVATSPDLRSWTVRGAPLLGAAPEEGANVSGADLLTWNGQRYIMYGSSSGNISARSVNAQLTATGDPQKLFVPPRTPPEEGRAGSPQIVTDDAGVTHLFYELGTRSRTTIGHAVLDPSGVRDPFNPHPSDPTYATCPGGGSDGFGGTTLNSTWNHGVRTSADRSTVSGGALRIPTYAGNSTNVPLILRGLHPTPWEVTTRVVIDPQQNFQQAGLIARVNDANSARISISHVDAGKRVDFVWRNNGVDRNVTGDLSLGDNVLVPSGTTQVWLRMMNDGTYLTASYSLDGVTFAPVGRYIPRAQLSPVDVGPFAYRGSSSVPEITASFDWFRYTPTASELAACG